MLMELIALIPNMKVANVVMDFEYAMKNAFLKVFSNIKITHCLFYFGQIIWRTIQKKGLSGLYKEDSKFRFWIKMLLATAFLPSNRVSCAFYELKCIIISDYKQTLVKDLLDFFENNYISKGNFEYVCHEVIFNNIPKTNNVSEGFNRALNSFFIGAYPSLLSFIFQTRNQSFFN